MDIESLRTVATTAQRLTALTATDSMGPLHGRLAAKH